MPTPLHTLYGIPPSLYTGKARSYLIKNHIPYREVAPGTKHFWETVLPRAGGRNSLPTIETPEGEVVRDGAAILDHFEAQSGHRATPTGPRQRILSRLIDVIGMEGLLRPAMHYRWNFPTENQELLAFHFLSLSPPGVDPVSFAELAMNAMRKATRAFGVSQESIPGVERRYEALLPLLDRHFEAFPYLFGGRASIADYSLLAPLYGHLGRDPKPLSMMQATAIHLFRWVERMNRPGTAWVDYLEDGEEIFGDEFLPNDEIPATLVDLLRHLAVDFVPETVASAEFINDWLAQQNDLAPGTPLERQVGFVAFEVEGEAISAMAQPYRHFLLNRVHEDFDGLAKPDRKVVEELLEACRMAPVLDARLTRSIGRANNLEVWGAG